MEKNLILTITFSYYSTLIVINQFVIQDEMNLCQSVITKGLGTRFTRIDSAVFAHGIIGTQGAVLVLISGAIGNLKKRYHQCQYRQIMS